jgi:hypothetical protein
MLNRAYFNSSYTLAIDMPDWGGFGEINKEIIFIEISIS